MAISEQQKPKTHILLARCLSLASSTLLYFHALMLVVCKISMEPLGEDVHVMSVVKRIIVSAVVKEAGPSLTVLF